MKPQSEKFLRALSMACIASFALSAHAQELWKYTDKSGNVTYSDKAPGPGEKAERVNADTAGTVISAPKNVVGGAPQNSATIRARLSASENLRDSLRKEVDAAREELERAKKARDAGEEPTAEERQIVVGRGKDGKPTGANAVLRKPEYDQRIAALDSAVSQAEENVAKAERNARQNSPK